MQKAFLAVATACGSCVIVGCGTHGSNAIPTTTSASRQAQSVTVANSRIKHVVIIVQENRSFDNLFNGFPGADTVRTGLTHDGKVVSLQEAPLLRPIDVPHSHLQFESAYDGGKNDGFDLEGHGPLHGATPPPATYPYSYTKQSDVQTYWTLAQKYALADRMFQSNTGSSFPAHQYLIAAKSIAADSPAKKPWGCDSPPGTSVQIINKNGVEVYGPFPCFDYPTLADEMDSSKVSWRYYAPGPPDVSYIWSAFDAIRGIRFGPDWTTKVVSPETKIVDDIAAGHLAQVTWVVPTYFNSDHAGRTVDNGPAWVAAVVDAVGKSRFWNTTAIFIVWDDWGGWYDHVPPLQLDLMSLGFRVPLIVVSPYSQHGYVSHVQHEFGSLLHFTEETFGLPSLGQTDVRADDLADCFNFLQTPAPFVPVKPVGSVSQALHAPEQDPDPDQ